MTAIDADWNITEVESGQWPALEALQADAFPGQDSMLEVVGDSAIVFGAVVDDVIVGYLVATRSEGRVELWEHVVHAAHRGRGIGRSLLYHLVHHLPEELVVVVDPAGLLDDDRLADYYGDQGFSRLDSGEVAGYVAAVDDALEDFSAED